MMVNQGLEYLCSSNADWSITQTKSPAKKNKTLEYLCSSNADWSIFLPYGAPKLQELLEYLCSSNADWSLGWNRSRCSALKTWNTYAAAMLIGADWGEKS